MENWNDGYVTDISYTYGYYNELNPLRIKLAFLNAGLEFPEVKTACELAYGQGVSINIHAATSTVKWYGTDFNPAQANFSQSLAKHSGADITLKDDSFEEFFKRDDLPDFDYIGFHGTWSWISEGNQQIIVNFLKKKLKVGGVVYISYNTLPGWSAMAPIRHLLSVHAERLETKGAGMLTQMETSLAFAESLLATKPIYATHSPTVPGRLKQLKGQDRNYLAHEYLNNDWKPMYFSDVMGCLSQAKLEFACSAHYLDSIPLLNFTEEQQQFLASISDVLVRETVRDFMVNQQFRRDYWVKGAQRISPLKQAELLRSQKIMLVSQSDKVPLEVECIQGKVTMKEEIYRPILEALADHTPKTIAELEGICPHITFNQIAQAVIFLAGFGHIVAIQDHDDLAGIKTQTQALNTHLIDKARGDNDINYLASPICGGGVAVGRVHKLFIMALGLGKESPEDLAAQAWEIFSAQGQLLIKDGETLKTPEENLEELKRQATTFIEESLPILQALEIADRPI